MSNDNAEVGKRLREIRERADKATEGPWETQYGYKTSSVIVRTPKGYGRIVLAQDWEPRQGIDGPLQDDAAFIAHARTDIPYLLSLNEALAERVKALEYELGYFASMSGHSVHNRYYIPPERIAHVLELLGGIDAVAKALEQPPLDPMKEG